MLPLAQYTPTTPDTTHIFDLEAIRQALLPIMGAALAVAVGVGLTLYIAHTVYLMFKGKSKDDGIPF